MKTAVLLVPILSLEVGTAFTTPRPILQGTSSTRIFSQTEDKTNGVFSDEVQQEAREVLEKVGWARPMEGDGELTSEDPFVKQIDAGIQADFGVGLDDLLNPAKVGTLTGTLAFSD